MDEDSAVTLYKECQRNHAAGLGMQATDGCNEYIRDSAKPHGMFCQACGCHRNFHHKVLVLEKACKGVLTNEKQSDSTSTNTSTRKEQLSNEKKIQGVIDLTEDDAVDMFDTTRSKPTPAARIKWKRYTAEQKGKILSVCKMLGWKMPGRGNGTDDVNSVCGEVGMTRDAFRKFLDKHKAEYL